MKYDHEAIRKYIGTLQVGERVVETNGCMSGCEGVVYMSEHNGEPVKCVKWNLTDGNQMGTSVTGGTRRLHEKDLRFEL